jgi:UDP-N-acetylglucosamine--dolichyl-phosphate N-acetylglucosaminephosphotransferase
MMPLILLIPIFVSLVVTLLILPHWIGRAKKVGLFGRDIQKINRPIVAEAGGLTIVAGFILGVLTYVAIKTFYYNTTENVLQIFSLLSSLLIISFVGLTDDILGWKIGLSKKLRMLLVLFAAIPLIVIKAGDSTIALPFLGVVNIGLLYTFLIIPIGVVGATTTFNFLAGFNGLEAGQGILLLTAFGITAYFTGSTWIALITLCLIASTFAFLLFNFYPAKVFPGDSLTYTIGGLLAISAILGNFEKIAVFFFIPYIIEVVLKLRGNLKKESFGKPTKSGELDLLYPKLYGLTHVSIWTLKKIGIKSTEKNAVYLIWIFQAIIIILGFIIFRERIFL